MIHDWAADGRPRLASSITGVPLIGGDRSALSDPDASRPGAQLRPTPDTAAATARRTSERVGLRAPDVSVRLAADCKPGSLDRVRGSQGAVDPDPVAWMVEQTPPDTTDGLPDGSDDRACNDRTGVPTRSNAAFHSGCGTNLDRAIVIETTVPNTDPTLRFATLFCDRGRRGTTASSRSRPTGARPTRASPDGFGARPLRPPDPRSPSPQVQSSTCRASTGISATGSTSAYDLTAYAGTDGADRVPRTSTDARGNDLAGAGCDRRRRGRLDGRLGRDARWTDGAPRPRSSRRRSTGLHAPARVPHPTAPYRSKARDHPAGSRSGSRRSRSIARLQGCTRPDRADRGDRPAVEYGGRDRHVRRSDRDGRGSTRRTSLRVNGVLQPGG